MSDAACRCVHRPPGRGCIWPHCFDLVDRVKPSPVEDLAEIRRKMEALLAFARRVARLEDDPDLPDNPTLALLALIREARKLVKA